MRVERKVGVWALGVVVRRGHARARGVEGTAGDQRGRGTGSGAGEHLRSGQLALERAIEDPAEQRTFATSAAVVIGVVWSFV